VCERRGDAQRDHEHDADGQVAVRLRATALYAASTACRTRPAASVLLGATAAATIISQTVIGASRRAAGGSRSARRASTAAARHRLWSHDPAARQGPSAARRPHRHLGYRGHRRPTTRPQRPA
jgi:hypothetical protein